MAHKKIFGIHPFYLLTLMYVVVTMVLGMIINNGLIIFLGWNIVLATLVFGLAQLFVNYRQHQYPFWISYLLFIIFVLFFPNTFYLLTDTIHFQAYGFFADYPSVYALMMEDWIVFTVVTVGALYGVKLGISSLDLIRDVHYEFIKKHETLYIILLFILSSTGIYLGRFIRLNSWNFFDLEAIALGIINHLDFFLGFVMMFTLIHGIGYFLFSTTHEIKYNQTIESEE